MEHERARDEYERAIRGGKITERVMVDYCFHFDSMRERWIIRRRDGVGGECRALTLEVDAPVTSRARFLDVKAELIVNGATGFIDQSAEVNVAYLRTLRVYDQVIPLGVVGAAGCQAVQP